MKKIIIDESTVRTTQFGKLRTNDVIFDDFEYVILGDVSLGDVYYDKQFKDLKLTDIVITADYAVDEGGIKDSTINLREYLTDYLKDDDDFLVFVGLLELVFNDIKSVADDFCNLSDVDNVVEIFLPKLSYLVNYKYNYNIPADINRDLIKRMLWLYKQKGTDADILNAANYGNNDKWVGSTLFLPGATPDNKVASLTYPINNLFTHNVSKHSGTHRYQDSTRWRDGVLIISLITLTTKVREAVKSVVPAGIKIFYDILSQMPGDGEGGSISFGEWVLHEDYTMEYRLRIQDIIRSSTFDGTTIYSPHRLSGKQILFLNKLCDITKAASFLPALYGEYVTKLNNNIDYEIDGIELYKKYKGLPIRSVNAGRSGKYAYSGDHNLIRMQAPIEQVKPTNMYYPVSAVENLRPNLTEYSSQYEVDNTPEINTDYLKDYASNVEVRYTSTPKSKKVSDALLSEYVDDGYSQIRSIQDLKLTDLYSDGTLIGDLKLDDLIKTYTEVR